jgi:hypothetical protein
LCVDMALVRSVDVYPACGFGAHQIVNHPARNGDDHIPCLWS